MTEQTQTTEAWREIPNTDYSVSSEGQVASRKFGKWRILRLSLGSFGYPLVHLCIGGEERTRRVHHLVAGVFIGPQPTPAHQINHKNGLRWDSRAVNLEWVTQSENMRHRFDVLEHPGPHGERNGKTKLTEVEVREILTRHAAGEKRKSIAADYGVGETNVDHIIHGRTWAWISEARQ